jgi:hypothetical protein
VKKQVPIEKITELPMISRMKRIKEDKGGERAVVQLNEEVVGQLEKIALEYGIVFEEEGDVTNARSD